MRPLLVDTVFFLTLFVMNVHSATTPGGISAKSNMCENVTVTEPEVAQFIFANHTPWARPVRNARNAIDVSFRLILSSIEDVIEKEKIVKFNGYLTIKWDDELHIWNHTLPYACLDSLVIPAQLVWLPEVATLNSDTHYELISPRDNVQRIRMYSNGSVSYRTGGSFVISCDFDLRYFPFDEQTCFLALESWRYTHQYQTLSITDPPISFQYWLENDHWQITGWNHRIAAVSYVNKENSMDHIEFEISMKRKFGYYLANVVIPSVIVSCAQISVFSMPAGEVMKIHVSFTCLLAYGVFQLMIVTDMPRSSDHVPLLSIYITLSMIYIAATMLTEGTVFVCLRIAENKTYRRKVPDWVFATASLAAVAFGVHNPIKTNAVQPVTSDGSNERHDNQVFPYTVEGGGQFARVVQEVRAVQQLKVGKKAGIDESSSHESDTSSRGEDHEAQKWRFVADVIDRAALVTYCLVIIVTPIAMFAILPQCI